MTTRVLITGAGGYVGSTLVRRLLAQGAEVVAVDRFFFGRDTLPDEATPGLQVIRADVRRLPRAALEGVDAVIDLAAISNDPAGALAPGLTREINFLARTQVASDARAAGVARYVLFSSCSVYGAGAGRGLTEEAPTDPLTVYAECNVSAEHALRGMGSDEFSVTCLRNATMFGPSPRMRFDLVVNVMTLHAVRHGVVQVLGGGEQIRPLVHVDDVCDAAVAVLDAPRERVADQVFNIGHDNHDMRSVARLVAGALPFDVRIEVADDEVDQRDYHASFDKAAEVLGFRATTTVAEGVAQIHAGLRDETLRTGPLTRTTARYERLLEAEEIFKDNQLDGGLLSSRVDETLEGQLPHDEVPADGRDAATTASSGR